MKKILLFASFLLLTACPTVSEQPKSGKPAADGYVFEAKYAKLLQPERTVKLVIYPSYEAVRASYKQRKNSRPLAEGEELQAFSVITKDACFIHTIDPAVRYDPRFIGHELTHCLYGEWHPNQNERG